MRGRKVLVSPVAVILARRDRCADRRDGSLRGWVIAEAVVLKPKGDGPSSDRSVAESHNDLQSRVAGIATCGAVRRDDGDGGWADGSGGLRIAAEVE